MRNLRNLFLSLLCAMLAAGVHASEVFQSVPGMGGPVEADRSDSIFFEIDDGTNENNVGLNNTQAGTATQFFWFNAFAVHPNDLPVPVNQVRIFWDSTPVGAAEVGDAISISIYVDVDEDFGNGLTHVHSASETVGVVGTAFDSYDIVNFPDQFAAVRLLVGVVDRWITTGVSTTAFPAAIDQTPPNHGRSWVASYTGATVPSPPVLPSDGLFGTIDSFGLPGNWLIRATGVIIPVELQTFTID